MSSENVKLGENAAKVFTSKTHRRKVTENEVLKSDRLELVEQANRLVESMVAKTTLPKIGSGYAVEVELSDSEMDAYATALGFLRRQFEQGYSLSEVLPKREETEDTTECQAMPTENNEKGPNGTAATA